MYDGKKVTGNKKVEFNVPVDATTLKDFSDALHLSWHTQNFRTRPDGNGGTSYLTRVHPVKPGKEAVTLRRTDSGLTIICRHGLKDQFLIRDVESRMGRELGHDASTYTSDVKETTYHLTPK